MEVIHVSPVVPSLPALHPFISTHKFCLSQALLLFLPSLHPSSSLIPLLFVHWLSSDSSCHRFQVNFVLPSSPHIILYTCFSSLFVNFISSRQRFLRSLYLSAFTEDSEKTIPFHNMQYTLFYFISCSIFLAFFHFSFWSLAVRLLELLSCISRSFDRCPVDSSSFSRDSIQLSLWPRERTYLQKIDARYMHQETEILSISRDDVRSFYISNKVRVPSLVLISKLLIFMRLQKKDLVKLCLIR